MTRHHTLHFVACRILGCILLVIPMPMSSMLLQRVGMIPQGQVNVSIVVRTLFAFTRRPDQPMRSRSLTTLHIPLMFGAHSDDQQVKR